jgi:arginine utilization protein RocB
MKDYTEKELYGILMKLVGIPSVSPSSEKENEIARFIYDTLAGFTHFQKNPSDLRLLPLEGDSLGRHLVFAMVRSPRKTLDTVILAGHMDVVGTEACGSLAPWAFDPVEYTRRIGSTEISPEARKDLETGEWLFGRGISDMKSGVATGLKLLMDAARDPSSLEVNLAVLVVPDEENNSSGMLSAASYLARFQEKEGLRYLACVELEPTFATGDEARPSIYLGSIGKINPFFFCAGKETHVGEYYEGFCAAPIISRINLMLDGNPEYADALFGKAYPPFGCMRQIDLRREYSATIMTKAFAFYSYLTATKLPGDILSGMRKIAAEALDGAIEQYESNASDFARRCGFAASPKKWTPTVLTFAELSKIAGEKMGEGFGGFVSDTLGSAPPGSDERIRAAALVEAMVDLCAIPGPMVVIGFLPPWYPHRSNLGMSEGEKLMKKVASEASEMAESRFGNSLEIRPFFEGVSDLSYCGFQGDSSEMDLFAENMPGWGCPYSLPKEALAKLDIPILNFGPLGKDAHKNTERIHLPYAMDVYPELLAFIVRRIAGSANQ